MTTFVIRGGKLVDKARCRRPRESRGDFPTPMLSRIEPFESPVTGKEITSWRERDKDMAAAGAVDPRDLPAPTKGRAARGGKNGGSAADDTFQWRDPA